MVFVEMWFIGGNDGVVEGRGRLVFVDIECCESRFVSKVGFLSC